MQVPHRRSEKDNVRVFDPHMTQEKYDALAAKLERLNKETRFKWMTEVAVLAEGGDFSENAGYQAAKSKLRGINDTILELQMQLKKAIIIDPQANTDRVGLGHHVTVSLNGTEKTYLLLGSSEVDPLRNVISHNSPLGSALIGKRVGETVTVDIKGRKIKYTVKYIA